MKCTKNPWKPGSFIQIRRTGCRILGNVVREKQVLLLPVWRGPGFHLGAGRGVSLRPPAPTPPSGSTSRVAVELRRWEGGQANGAIRETFRTQCEKCKPKSHVDLISATAANQFPFPSFLNLFDK